MNIGAHKSLKMDQTCVHVFSRCVYTESRVELKIDKNCIEMKCILYELVYNCSFYVSMGLYMYVQLHDFDLITIGKGNFKSSLQYIFCNKKSINEAFIVVV